MKKLLKVIYILGFMFWTSFLIYGLVMLTAYNGFGNHYSFTCIDADDFKIIEQANRNLKILYTYNVGTKTYNNDERISSELFYEKIKEKSHLAICYNDTYPSLSYVKEVNLSVSRQKTGVTISSFFLILISIMYVFAKRDYWLEKYHTFFNKF